MYRGVGVGVGSQAQNIPPWSWHLLISFSFVILDVM